MLSDWLNTFGRKKLEDAKRKSFLKMVDSGKVQITPTHVIDMIYLDLRVGNYPNSPRDKIEIEEIAAQATHSMEVMPKDGWYHRMPSNRRAMGWSTSDKSIDRISLNVHAEPELIPKLDAFCSKYRAYYKTPQEMARWENRHDPITIYFHEEISPQIEAELKTIVTPHIRAHNLHGRKIAEGICAETSPSVQEIDGLISRAEKLDPELGKHVRKAAYALDPCNPTAKIEAKLSAGQKRAIEIALDDYEQHAASVAPGVSHAKPSKPPAAGEVARDAENAGETVADQAKNLVTHSEGGLSRFWQEGKWLGRKGLIVGGAVAGVGAVVYGVKSYVGAEKERQKPASDSQGISR